jgi:hypothetical protein
MEPFQGRKLLRMPGSTARRFDSFTASRHRLSDTLNSQGGIQLGGTDEPVALALGLE